MPTHLLPTPNRPETIKEAHIFKQVRIQPDTRRNDKHRHAEQDESEDGHGEEQPDKAQHSHTQVPHTDPEFDRPQGKQDDGEQNHQGTEGVQFLFPLRSLVQPDEVQAIFDFLLLLNLHRP